MRTTTGTKNKIKQFEGLRLEAYVCAAGVCTIGYGHTTSVKPGDVITAAQADAFFESDIRAVETQVNALPLHLGQYQFDCPDVTLPKIFCRFYAGYRLQFSSRYGIFWVYHIRFGDGRLHCAAASCKVIGRKVFYHGIF